MTETDEVARALIEQHMKYCDEDRHEMREQLGRMSAAVEKVADATSDGLKRVHDRIDQGVSRRAAIALWLGGGAGASFVSIIGFLLLNGSPWSS